jgi:hypothetical protein
VLAALNDILTIAYPSTDGAHWGAVGEPLAAALLAEVETDSGHEFVEHFLQHETLKAEQRGQTLEVVARVSKDDPAIAEGAHRAVAAAPEDLLPFAIQAAAELDTDDAAHWLSGTQQAVSARAAQPDADTALYQRAADLVDQAQDCLAAGISPSRLIDDTEGTGTSRLDSTPAGPAPNRHRNYVLVKPKVKWHLRLVLTAVSLAYLAAITITSAGVASSNGLGDGWVGWLYVPGIVGFNLIVASYWGGGRVELSAGVTWLGLPMVVVLRVVP